MTPHRLALLALLPLSLSLSCAKNTGGGGGSLANNVEMTGIESIDSVFREARDIDVRLDNARTSLTVGRDELNAALGLSEGTPFADALADLQAKAQGKLQVTMNGTTPTLSVSDAVPANVQAAVDAANRAVGNYQAAVDELLGVKDELQGLVSACQALPGQIQKDAGSLGLKLTEIPKTLGTVNDNLGLVQNFPNRVDRLTGELNANLQAVTGAFGGHGGTAGTQASGSGQGSSTSSEGRSSSGSQGSGTTSTPTEKPKPVPLPR